MPGGSMAALSAPANIISLFGAADIVARLTVQVIDTYVKSRDSSDQISRLVLDLKSLHQVTLRAHAFIDNRRAAGTSNDAQPLPPILEETLRKCEGELHELQKIAMELQADAKDYWFKKWTKNIAWSLSVDGRIQSSCARIESYKGSLNVLLNLVDVESKDVICEKLATTGTAFLAATQGIERETTQTSALVVAGNRANTASFSNLEHKVEKLASLPLQEICGTISRQMAKSFRESAIQLAPSKPEATSVICSSSQQATEERRMLNIRVWCFDDDDSIYFEVESPQYTIVPLILTKAELLLLLRSLNGQNRRGIAALELARVEKRLDDLLDFVRGDAALASDKTSRNRRASARGATGMLLASGKLHHDCKARDVAYLRNSSFLLHESTAPYQIQKSSRHSAHVGTLHITTWKDCNDSTIQQRLFFLPDSTPFTASKPCALAIEVVKCRLSFRNPLLYRSVQDQDQDQNWHLIAYSAILADAQNYLYTPLVKTDYDYLCALEEVHERWRVNSRNPII